MLAVEFDENWLTTHSSIITQNISITWETFLPSLSTPDSHSSPLKSLVCFLSLYFLPFLEVHMKGIKEHIYIFLCLPTFIQNNFFFLDSSTLLHVSVAYSFVLLSSVPLYGYTTMCLSICQLMNM